MYDGGVFTFINENAKILLTLVLSKSVLSVHSGNRFIPFCDNNGKLFLLCLYYTWKDRPNKLSVIVFSRTKYSTKHNLALIVQRAGEDVCGFSELHGNQRLANPGCDQGRISEKIKTIGRWSHVEGCEQTLIRIRGLLHFLAFIGPISLNILTYRYITIFWSFYE